MPKSKPVTMLISYYPKEGQEAKLLSLIKKHWVALNHAGLSSKMPPQVWRATDKRTSRSYFVEMFQWKDDRASGIAHHTPEVLAIWKPMESVIETMQLSRIEPVPLPKVRSLKPEH